MTAVRTVQVTFDCADPGALAQFWAAALHYVLQPPPPGFESWDAALDAWGVPPENRNDRSSAVDPESAGPRLFFQKVPEGKTAKNRVHLDVRTAPGLTGDDRTAASQEERDRLVGLGARQLQMVAADGINQAFIVMQDPEGNEFCLD